MRETCNDKRLHFGVTTGINNEDFALNEDYGSTSSSSSEINSDVSMLGLISPNGHTIGDEGSPTEMTTMKRLSLTSLESQLSSFSLSEILILSPNNLNVLSLQVKPSIKKEGKHLPLQTPAVVYSMKKQSLVAKEMRAFIREPFQICNKIKSTGLRTHYKSLSAVNVPCLNYCSTSDLYAIGDRSNPVSPASSSSLANLTKSPELPPVLQLHKYPLAQALPDHMSCVISKRSEKSEI